MGKKSLREHLALTLFLALPLAVQSQSYKELVDKAMDLTMKDSLVQAEALYRQALKLEPANARNALAFSNLGTVLKRQGKTDEAIESYTMALNIIPYSTAILLNRATLYMEKNLLEKAYVDYCSVIDLLPSDKEARLFRAYIYMKRRQYKEARIDYNTLLAADMKNKAARVGLVMLDEKEGKLVAAVNGLNLLINENPQDVSLLRMRANIEIEQGFNDLALADLEEAARLSPSDTDVYVAMGDLCLEMKKKKEAREAYERAIALGVSRAELLSKLKKCK